MNAVVMSPAVQRWSLPWHALQRSLAYRPDAAGIAATDIARILPRIQAPAPPVTSWLARALANGHVIL